ncbi:UBX domain-containing protein 4 [Mactra antiquata]
MQWFQGKIPDAIQLSKQRGSLFIVYIYGQDELSGQMNSTWDDDAVSKCIQDSGAVVIRIENTSDECRFFSQIYPVVCVPSTFCIGDGGIPLEVIGGHVKPEDFVNKLKQVEQTHSSKKQSVVTTPSNNEQTSSTEQATTSASASGGASGGASGDQESQVPLDEKVQRAKELLEKTKEEKAKKEFEKNREEEIKRRKLGQDLVSLKKNQQEAQMKELKEQMRKDKEEERKAKEKIRQQIARDREERQKKFEKEKQDREKAADEKKREKLLQQQQQAAADEAKKSETARIQVRLPDGSSISQTFPSSDTLQSLHNFITEKTGQSMTLSTTFPKRKFTEEDMSSTFIDLQLAPSAVVIALPGGSARGQASSSSAVQSGGIFSLLLSPFMFLWNFLYSLLFGSNNSGGDNSSTQESTSSQPDTTTQYTRRTDRPSTAYQRRGGGGGTSRVRRIHDLSDDEDMSTYNGNSTQQL